MALLRLGIFRVLRKFSARFFGYLLLFHAQIPMTMCPGREASGHWR